MKIINKYLKIKLIDKYTQLLPILVQRYGVRKQYTVPQIESTIKKAKLSTQYTPYAIALYRHQASHRTINLYRINQVFLDILRDEISAYFFDGYEYGMEDIFKHIAPDVWRGGRESVGAG